MEPIKINMPSPKMEQKKEACLVCGEDLQYFETAREMECMICHRKFMSKASCKNGHYVCDECHSKTAIEHIETFCLASQSKNPYEIAIRLMEDPYVHMHGPENHVLVGSALLTAYHNCSGELDLKSALAEMRVRGSKVPGGACGFWGCCGAAVSTGMFISIVTGATPLTKETWGLSNLMTARALQSIGDIGGPRCCKRNAFLAIKDAVEVAKRELGVNMELPNEIVCGFTKLNKQCIGQRCPFNPINHHSKKPKVAFICVHNSCRSQIAEALGHKLASDVFESYSAGTETKPQINQDAVRLMKEDYQIDMEATQYSKLLDDIPPVDYVITMGCNVSCPNLPCSHREDWGLDDPTGKSDEEFREVMHAIEQKIMELRQFIM